MMTDPAIFVWLSSEQASGLPESDGFVDIVLMDEMPPAFEGVVMEFR